MIPFQCSMFARFTVQMAFRPNIQNAAVDGWWDGLPCSSESRELDRISAPTKAGCSGRPWLEMTRRARQSTNHGILLASVVLVGFLDEPTRRIPIRNTLERATAPCADARLGRGARPRRRACRRGRNRRARSLGGSIPRRMDRREATPRSLPLRFPRTLRDELHCRITGTWRASRESPDAFPAHFSRPRCQLGTLRTIPGFCDGATSRSGPSTCSVAPAKWARRNPRERRDRPHYD
jgi:hypothetical protein